MKWSKKIYPGGAVDYTLVIDSVKVASIVDYKLGAFHPSFYGLDGKSHSGTLGFLNLADAKRWVMGNVRRAKKVVDKNT